MEDLFINFSFPIYRGSFSLDNRRPYRGYDSIIYSNGRPDEEHSLFKNLSHSFWPKAPIKNLGINSWLSPLISTKHKITSFPTRPYKSRLKSFLKQKIFLVFTSIFSKFFKRYDLSVFVDIRDCLYVIFPFLIIIYSSKTPSGNGEIVRPTSGSSGMKGTLIFILSSIRTL